MRTGAKGLNLIRRWEAYRQFAYPDPYSPLAKAYPKANWGFRPAADILAELPSKARTLDPTPWTVGYGETQGVDINSKRTKSEADSHLISKLAPVEQVLTKLIKVQTTQEQFDAMMALLWNIGETNFRPSTVLKQHNAREWAAAGRAFGLFNKVRNRTTKQLEVSEGLVNRRAQESSLYLSSTPEQYDTRQAYVESDMAQGEVAPESRPTESPINRAAVAGGATATVAAVSETTRAVSDIKYNMSNLQDWIIPMLLIAVVVLCGYIIYQRLKQRKEGWA